jgi:hypothetical protein
MVYITEYEVVNGKYCGIVKTPNNGASVFMTELCNTHEEAYNQVAGFLKTKTTDSSSNTPAKRPCCGN